MKNKTKTNNHQSLIVIALIILLLVITFGIIIYFKNKKGNNYNIYFLSSTLTSLYGSFDMAQNDDYSFIYFARANTFDTNKLGSESRFKLSAYNGDNTQDEKVFMEIKDEVSKIIKKDKNAHFRLFLDDTRYYVEFQTLASLGLKDNQYDIIYASEGTLSYTFRYSYQSADNFNNYQTNVDLLNKVLTDYRNNGRTFEEYDKNLIIPSSTRSNVKYYLQYPDYLITESDDLKNVFKTCHFIAKGPKDIYDSLTSDQKEKVLSYLGFDKKTFDQEYFNDNSKPYLIITGAKPIEYSYGIKKFKNMIEQVVTKYGKDYNIVFKPHPAALPDETYTKYFNDLGIKILPGRMPMEVISFTYPNLYYGGFASSLYMSVPENSALFFFAQKSNDLFVPLDTLAGTIFKEASYIQPK